MILAAVHESGFGTKRRKTMSAAMSASGGLSGNVANRTNSTLLTHLCHSAIDLAVMQQQRFFVQRVW
jgi:hypothetical protein